MRMSIGQALGIVTAGDRRCAAERNGLRRGKKAGTKLGAQKEREVNEVLNKKRANFLREKGVSPEIISAMLALK
jgi:hypothetical protein